ncbi:Uncharacterized protein conserved in bacteria [Suttonella ornithocola]|uniref:Uncharacterized protein conserved in bacteria n=1 Tax=Suttonella ornithocola TaxID=279832 RepID=A0A380MMT6_9GAMM|nr:Uncharacterized protein conserved in bacteria [Suttonella ornithocola]
MGWLYYILHPPPPIGELATENHQYLAQVAKRIAQESLPVMVVGDFNQSPYSPSYFRFKRDIQGKTLLVNGLPTWKPFYLHIDHVFVKGLSAQAKGLDWLHSDHRPIKIVYLSK